MQIERLQAKGPDHKGDLCRDYWALYAAGHVFRDRAARFLTKNPTEPQEVYDQRLREACYRSYIGTVCDYFAALLFATQLIYGARLEGGAEVVELPEWVSLLEGDCDGSETDLTTFLHERLVEAMVKRYGYWRLDFPENYGSGGASKAEAAENGALDVRLAAVQREDVVDCERDQRGKLLWAITHETSRPRPEPGAKRDRTLHQWWVLTRTRATLFEALVEDNQVLDERLELPPTRIHEHNLGVVPLVCLDTGPGLWVANRLESPQLEHFRLTSANNWSMRKTCYAMPVFSVSDPENFAPARMGAGYYLTIGKDEKMDWSAPPTAHLEVVRSEIDAQKDEIFRLVTQMSLGIDNNAAAVGRSAESKLADAEAIQVVLSAYGSKVRDTVRATLNMLARARGEAYEWTVEGLDSYDTLPPDTLVELLEKALDMKIPSSTWLAEVKTRAALALTPGLDRATKDKIREEIAEGVEAEDEEEDDVIADDSDEDDDESTDEPDGDDDEETED